MVATHNEWNELGDFRVARDAFLEDFYYIIKEVAPRGWKPRVTSMVHYRNLLPYSAVVWELTEYQVLLMRLTIYVNDLWCFTKARGWPRSPTDLGSFDLPSYPEGGLMTGWRGFDGWFKELSLVHGAVRKYALPALLPHEE